MSIPDSFCDTSFNSISIYGELNRATALRDTRRELIHSDLLHFKDKRIDSITSWILKTLHPTLQNINHNMNRGKITNSIQEALKISCCDIDFEKSEKQRIIIEISNKVSYAAYSILHPPKTLPFAESKAPEPTSAPLPLPIKYNLLDINNIEEAQIYTKELFQFIISKHNENELTDEEVSALKNGMMSHLPLFLKSYQNNTEVIVSSATRRFSAQRYLIKIIT